MAISVLQAQFASSFTNSVTAGSTLFYVPICYEFGSSVISTSAPTYNGGSVSGATLLGSVQNAYSAPTDDIAYTGAWMLPNVAGGGKTTGLSISGGTILDMAILEVAGLGSSPSLDQSSTGDNPDTASLSSGATGNTTTQPEFVLAGGVAISEVLTLVGTPWTSIQDSSKFGQASYQISTTSGSSYTWSTSAAATNAWAAFCFTIKGTGGGGGPTYNPGLLMAGIA